MRKTIKPIFAFLLIALFSVGCEETFIPDDTAFKEQIVVEGFVEASQESPPVYVVLTRSFPFYESISTDQIDGLFVRGASVSVNDGDKDVILQEICLDQLTPELKELIATQFGLNADSTIINFCVYVDLLDQVIKEVGRTYELNVNADGQQLSALTSIPNHVGLDSFFFMDPPGSTNDTLAELWTKINDPTGVTNYYRYFTGENDSPLVIPFQSVTDDVFFDGQEFEFPLNKAETGEDIDFSTFGLFNRGDDITIKWMTLDKNHYDFWSTLEFSRANQGPFASYTRIKTNVEGGIGVWGGISASYYRLKVPE